MTDLADVLAQHPGLDYADEEYYCLGCLEGLGRHGGVERRWAEHVEAEVAKVLVPLIHELARTAINTVYGTDDRHAFMGLRIAQAAVAGTPLPWRYSA